MLYWNQAEFDNNRKYTVNSEAKTSNNMELLLFVLLGTI